MTLQNRVHKALLLSGCIPTGSHLLVAVSGGADSVALLRLLHGLVETLKLSLEAAHLDHGLRAVSRDDAAFVAQLCHEMGVPVTVARQDVGSLEAGFVHMLERTQEAPQPLAARGEPDPLAVMVASALQVQRDPASTQVMQKTSPGNSSAIAR